MNNIDKLMGRMGNKMFQFAYLLNQVKLGEIPDVFVQSEEYFLDVRDEVKKYFSEGIPPKTDKVSIHVRRGDYVNNPFYVDLTEPSIDHDLGGPFEIPSYYERAMALFPGETFLVFSDDIAWCKEQTMFKACEFSEGKTEIEDMNVMASCKAHIIANSSFSWWAAYLGGGKTIAPYAWHPDGVERTSIPKTWTRI